MKVLKIEILRKNSEVSANNLIRAIHKFAEENGSTSKISLEGDQKRDDLIIIRSNGSVSNRHYYTGYLTLALYLSLYVDQDIAFPAFGNNSGWFEIWIKDPNAFIDAIS